MSPIETHYRNHTIVIRDESEFLSNAVTGTVDTQPVTKRIIEVDRVDITSRCRVASTDEEMTEAAKRFVDREYPAGNPEPECKIPDKGQPDFQWK